MKQRLAYFSRFEWSLWGVSVGAILLSFFLFDRTHLLTLAASLIGITSLIFNVKGTPFGQLMMIFSLLYGIISFSFAYYGERLTYFAASELEISDSIVLDRTVPTYKVQKLSVLCTQHSRYKSLQSKFQKIQLALSLITKAQGVIAARNVRVS